MNQKLPSTKILGVDITTADKKQISDFIITGLKEKSDKFYIVTPNPEIIILANRSSSYKSVLNGAQVSLPDGIGVLAAGNVLKKGIRTRITGIDFMLELCKECARVGLSIGLLGGRGGVAERTADCLREKYPSLRVNFANEEWPTGPAAPHLSTNHHSPNTNHIDLLFVAFGAPKQEEWIAENLPNIDITAAMGVGGAFDYISGKIPRAPKIVRSAGMEWAYRLARQPWRIKRQLALPAFAIEVLKERLSSSRH